MKKKKINTWKDAYLLPLHYTLEDMPLWVDDANGERAFDLHKELSPERARCLLELFNGNDTPDLALQGKFTYDDDNGDILWDGYAFITIRGWGHLTSHGGYNLDNKTAARIQDEFAAYLLERLNLNQRH